MNNEIIKVTVTSPSDNQTLTLDLLPDATLNDWIKVFKTILIFETFTEKQITELFEDKQWEYPLAVDNGSDAGYCQEDAETVEQDVCLCGLCKNDYRKYLQKK